MVAGSAGIVHARAERLCAGRRKRDAYKKCKMHAKRPSPRHHPSCKTSHLKTPQSFSAHVMSVLFHAATKMFGEMKVPPTPPPMFVHPAVPSIFLNIIGDRNNQKVSNNKEEIGERKRRMAHTENTARMSHATTAMPGKGYMSLSHEMDKSGKEGGRW